MMGTWCSNRRQFSSGGNFALNLCTMCVRCMNFASSVWQWSRWLSPCIVRGRSRARQQPATMNQMKRFGLGCIFFASVHFHELNSLSGRFLFSSTDDQSEVSKSSHSPWHTKRISFLFRWLATIVMQVDTTNKRAMWTQMSCHNTHKNNNYYYLVVVGFRIHTDLLPIILFHHGNLMVFEHRTI